MAGSVDQIEDVGLAVLGRIGQPHGLRLDGDAALALDIHGIEHLFLHLARRQAAGGLDQTVGQRRFAMVDMRNDGEVADVGNRDGCHGRGIAFAPRCGNHQCSILKGLLHAKLIPLLSKTRYAGRMSTASFLPASSRARRRPSLRRLAAWLAACASDPKASLWLVIGFAVAHAVLWTFILINLKAAQDVHMDVAEAFAWGQKFQLGYGKHPPLAGWVAGLWFKIFPVADWATYALAMATLGCGLVICWLIGLRVVDRRRAFFVVVMLALYPIFNFKGFKYNPDLLQLVTLPLVVLAYLNAFEKRSVRSGLWLGLAGALALMTKYWVLTMIGAIGLAALIHPDRLKFLRSPAPWVAIATLVVAMIPHLVWLKEVDFVPLTYAGDVYGLSSRAQSVQLVLGYIGHNLALLAAPVALAAIALAWPRDGRAWRGSRRRCSRAHGRAAPMRA